MFVSSVVSKMKDFKSNAELHTSKDVLKDSISSMSSGIIDTAEPKATPAGLPISCSFLSRTFTVTSDRKRVSSGGLVEVPIIQARRRGACRRKRARGRVNRERQLREYNERLIAQNGQDEIKSQLLERQNKSRWFWDEEYLASKLNSGAWGIQRSDQTAPAASFDTKNLLVREFRQLQVLDDLIRLRAADVVQHPILAFPRSANHAAAYDYHSGQALNGLISQAAAKLMDFGFQTPKQTRSIVALLALSDLDMVVTFFALSRLGYIVMMLSPRLSGKACVSLLEAVGCETIVYGETPGIRTTVGGILQRRLVSCHSLPRCSLDNKSEASFSILCRDRNPDTPAVILHSSGSTGPPKPLFLTHRALMSYLLEGPGLTSFSPLPWYHLRGLSTAFQVMWMRKTAYMWNAIVPMTAERVLTALEEARPELIAAVPYMIQLLVDDPRGIAALQNCTLVTYGGAACPDELGDRLIREGVNLGGSFGLQAGIVADSISRPEDDSCWNYLQFFDSVRPYVWMKPISETESLYECVYLVGHPALTTSNSDDPPGSFHSKDLFAPHPTIPERWKFVARLDDRITLINGEKVLPLSFEGYVKHHRLVHEAVVVGVGKATPGLLVLRSEEAGAQYPTGEDYLNAVWPSIEEANCHADAFAQISRGMVAILPYTANFPRTDNGSIVRAQVYQQYAELIETLYTAEARAEAGLQLDLAETQSHLLRLCWDNLGISISSVDADLFPEGIDSQKATHLCSRRNRLQRLWV
ncbi:AMP-dependent synthetase/ligase [Penicillium brevicompactum]|uniref:AMP-dependent synthetase/ligase n=1 Tax=Penicillium brevicompactum TaxID=5074 RepID=A0A9W9QV26_PENBR|nr:AMP-dependent synthetase/ligase [Penicillium brevicompactum]